MFKNGMFSLLITMFFLCSNISWAVSYHNKSYRTVLKLAKRGNPIAMFELGNRYNAGRTVKKNPKMAFKWYLSAAQKAHMESQRSVAWCYQNDDRPHHHYGCLELIGWFNGQS